MKIECYSPPKMSSSLIERVARVHKRFHLAKIIRQITFQTEGFHCYVYM